MGSFKQISKSNLVDSKYIDKIVVYLESEEDLQIFKERWFYDEGEFLEFRSADQGQGGGSNQVIQYVKNDREKGIIAFGIVDRDALMQHNEFNLLLEVDDEKYKKQRPFGRFVRQLCRWEIENYLLQAPEELENFLADVGKESPRKTRPVNDVIKELFNHCEILLPIMAANLLFHIKGCSSLGIGFGVDKETSDQSTEISKKRISKLLTENQEDEYADYLNQFEKFDQGIKQDLKTRFDRLSRIIDGKRLLYRVSHLYKLKEDYRYFLARRIKEKNRIDSEITSIIASFKNSDYRKLGGAKQVVIFEKQSL